MGNQIFRNLAHKTVQERRKKKKREKKREKEERKKREKGKENLYQTSFISPYILEYSKLPITNFNSKLT